MTLKAVEHIASLRGGSQAQIMRANNGAYFAVKFQGNPQHTRVLANEYLACRLAQLIELSVPQPVILEVDAATIREQNIAFTFAERRIPVKPGLQFGSSLIRDEETWDWLPRSLLGRIENVQEFSAYSRSTNLRATLTVGRRSFIAGIINASTPPPSLISATPSTPASGPFQTALCEVRTR